MAKRSHNDSRKSKDIGQFKEYVEEEREENRRESLRHHFDQKESERHYREQGSRKELEKKLRELQEAVEEGSIGVQEFEHRFRKLQGVGLEGSEQFIELENHLQELQAEQSSTKKSLKTQSYKTTRSEDPNGITARASYEITELEHLLHNLKAAGEKESIQYTEFEGYLLELRQLEHQLLELESSGSQRSTNYINLEHHLRLYIELVHKIRELQASGKQGSGQYVELEHQLYDLQNQGMSLGQGNPDKSYKSGGESTKYSGFTDSYKSGGESTKQSGFTDSYKRGSSRRSGNDGRSEINQLSYEIREVENELIFLADSGKRNTKEQKELERRLSDLQEAYSRAANQSYATGGTTNYRSIFSDNKTRTTKRSGEHSNFRSEDRPDTKSHSTKRTSGDDHDHRERKSILTKRSIVEDNNNQEDYSRHTEDHSDHKSHHRRSSTNSDNHHRRSSSGSGSGHHQHHHHHHDHVHGHCHRKPKPEEVERSIPEIPSRRPPPIPEEEESPSPPPSPPRKPLLVNNSCQNEPPPKKSLLVDNSCQNEPPPPPPPKKPLLVDMSCQKEEPPPPKKSLLVDNSCQKEPPPPPPPKKPLLVDMSCQKEEPPPTPVLKKSILCQDKAVGEPPPPLVHPSCKLTSDKTVTANPSCPNAPGCNACEPPPIPKPVPAKSCKMVADKPVGASSSFLSCFKPKRESTVESCQAEEPPVFSTKPEFIDKALSSAHFPEQCPVKPPPSSCPSKLPPPACPSKYVDPCARGVDAETEINSRHMMDTAAGKSYVAMDTGVGVSYPALSKIKSIYDNNNDDDDEYDLFPDREEDLEMPAPSEYPLKCGGGGGHTEIVEEYVNPNLCPYCGTGVFVKKTSSAGYLAAVLCFPCGLYCCLTQTCCYIVECTYCHATTEKSADDMKKTYKSPHRGTRESLQDVRSIYEVSVDESSDEGGRNRRRSTRDKYDKSYKDDKGRIYYKDDKGKIYYKDDEDRIYYKDDQGRTYFKDEEGRIYYKDDKGRIYYKNDRDTNYGDDRGRKSKSKRLSR